MIVTCPECEHPFTSICDFCKYYRFNGEDLGGRHGLVYVDKGCCSLHCLPSDPGDGCEYFHCKLTDRKKPTLQEAMDQVCDEIMKMTPEEFRAELDKPVENGIGDLLVESGIDLVEMFKNDNQSLETITREMIMEEWDYWRGRIADGDKSSTPRDWFENVLDRLEERKINKNGN